MSRMTVSLWREIMSYNLERSCATTTLAWGLVVLFFHPISSASPMMRGFYLADAVFAWLPFSSDYAWAAFTVIPAAIQIHLIASESEGRCRGFMAMIQATAFMAVAFFLLAANLRNTGTAMYLGVTVGHFASYMQLAYRRAFNA